MKEGDVYGNQSSGLQDSHGKSRKNCRKKHQEICSLLPQNPVRKKLAIISEKNIKKCAAYYHKKHNNPTDSLE